MKLNKVEECLNPRSDPFPTVSCSDEYVEKLNIARDLKHAFLIIPILLSRLIEKPDEDGVAEKPHAHNATMHFLTHVEREAPRGGSAALEPHLEPQECGPATGTSVGAELGVLSRVSHAGETVPELLHGDENLRLGLLLFYMGEGEKVKGEDWGKTGGGERLYRGDERYR